MPYDDQQTGTLHSLSGSAGPTRRKFLVNGGTIAAASVIGTYLPAQASEAGQSVSTADANAPAIEGAVPLRSPHQRQGPPTSRRSPRPRCWIAFAKRLLSPAQRRAVITGNAAHARCM